MLKGKTGTAEADNSNIHALGHVRAKAWRDRTRQTVTGYTGESAEILRLDDFRPVPPQPASRRKVDDGIEALHASITGMTRNLESQSEACRMFRNQISELRTEMEELGKNMDLYRVKLAGINVNPIRRKALRLAEMMEPWSHR